MGRNQHGERTDVRCGVRKGPVIKNLRRLYPGMEWKYLGHSLGMVGCWVSSEGWGVIHSSERIGDRLRVFYVRTDTGEEIEELGSKFAGESVEGD